MTAANAARFARPDWAIAPAEAERISGEFLRRYLARAGFTRLVVGLSGGIDSATSAALAVRALGADAVLGVSMPYRSSAANSLADATAVAEVLGIATESVTITPVVDAVLAACPDADHIRRGNIMARARMIVLYDISARDHRLVLGTGNRTESLLGYTTQYGDNACALNPLGQLYKTEVRLLAAHLGLPEAVLTKAPSADLWEGQSDEQELGVTYEEMDRLLHHMADEGLQPRQLTALGFRPELIASTAERIRAMAFKRRPPAVAAFPGRVDPDKPAAPRSGADAPLAEGGIH